MTVSPGVPSIVNVLPYAQPGPQHHKLALLLLPTAYVCPPLANFLKHFLILHLGGCFEYKQGY